MHSTRHMAGTFLGGGVMLLLACALIGAPEAQGCTIPPEGMLSWWDADDVSGTTAVDIEDGNDGMMVGGVALVPGKVDKAFSFDGVNDHVDLSALHDGVPEEISRFENTVDLWVKPAVRFDGSTGPQFMYAQWHRHFIAYALGGIFTRTVTCKTFTGLNCVGTAADFGPNVDLLFPIVLEPDQWHHIALTFKTGDTTVLYVDGQKVDEAPETTGWGLAFHGDFRSANQVKFSLGRKLDDAGSGFFLHGALDEAEVFNRALSADEVKAIYDAGSAGKCKAVVPFADFTVEKMRIEFATPAPGSDGFDVAGAFTLGPGDGIDPMAEPLGITVGTAALTVPAGSLTEQWSGKWSFNGAINGADVKVKMTEQPGDTYDFKIGATGVDLTDTANPVEVGVTMGGDVGGETVRLDGKLQFGSN